MLRADDGLQVTRSRSNKGRARNNSQGTMGCGFQGGMRWMEGRNRSSIGVDAGTWVSVEVGKMH
jgi:hypothetical protein